MLKVGIIDSGIPASAQPQVANAMGFCQANGAVRQDNSNLQDQLGHGSAVAEIITRHSPGIGLLIAKVFFNKLSCTAGQIAAALDWQIAQGARLINMSFGLHADRPALREACKRARHAGVVLVASSPARGNSVYPAHYSGIIRATGDARCGQNEISYLNSAQADFGGYVRAQQKGIAGASIGCAYVSSALVPALQNNPCLTRAELVAHLAAQASYSGPEHRSGTPTSRRHE